MTIEIYLDAINGSDTLGDGSELSPYKTIQYFCDSVAIKNNADYKVFLKNGVYEITNGTIFGQFNSGNITIIGKGENTEIVQKVYMYQNSIGGSVDFSLLIAKCKYNILTTLTGANVNGFRWKWSFYNVLFEYTPNNQTSVFSTNGKEFVLRNCVKLTNTTSFLRKNSSVISVYDSMGYFTSGYQTTQDDWDKGGNTIGSIQNYIDLLNYQGEYAWITSKTLILHGGEYKKWNPKKPSKTYQTILTPILTSNNPNEDGSGVIFSSERTSYKAFKAFDRKIPKVGDSYYWESMNSGTTVEQWIGYNFNNVTMVEYINVTVPTTYNSQPDSRVFPSYIHIEGSNELVEWDTIKSFTNLTWISGETKKFDLGQHNTYKAYRLRMLSSGYANVDVAEIEMYGSITTEAKEGVWSTVSSTLPISTKFLSDGMDNPLLDRKVTTLEPMEMTKKSGILGVGETGKVFSKTIDLKKYFYIKSIRTEVK